ncbi:MAG: hypothetical protein L0228_12070 [Planctomycetes bacterium]|nr:hypothetical protein [Planctomycetota bacterium]
MFLTLLVVTLGVAILTAGLVAWMFYRPIGNILRRIVADEIGVAWQRYVTFAIFVVGVSGGVRIWDLEKYITPQFSGQPEIELNTDRWVLEVYRTIIETIQSITWMLLVFFAVALIAYVIVRGFELKHGIGGAAQQEHS